ncbi:MAG: hypothetical protein Kow0020_11500 [Wenzhouxiangellaceae bacterium]
MASLQEALIQSGLARKEQAESRKRTQRSAGSGPDRKRGDRRKARGGAPGSGADAQRKRPAGPGNAQDLERAWKARRRAEAAEKQRAKQARVADQEARRQRNLALDRIVEGRVLNVDEAELPRYFEHLGRVRRVLCTEEQRRRINAGELGVVSLRGRYLIVEPEVLEAYRVVAPDLVPDLSKDEPDGMPEGDWPPVPDDLVW